MQENLTKQGARRSGEREREVERCEDGTVGAEQIRGTTGVDATVGVGGEATTGEAERAGQVERGGETDLFKEAAEEGKIPLRWGSGRGDDATGERQLPGSGPAEPAGPLQYDRLRLRQES